MKTLLFLLLPLSALSQMYTWWPNANPAWTSSNFSSTTLAWQPSINTVSTSGFNSTTGNWYTYNNSQVTTYTSPFIDLTNCPTSSYVALSLSLEINLENRFDWLYFQYSVNGGTTWINPVAQSASTNGSSVNLGAFPPLTNYTNVNSNRNGWTGNLGVINPVYIIPKTANMFRYIFVSDATVNSYSIGFNTYVYYADLLNFTVNCMTFLPVELKSFTGTKGNVLSWEVENEHDCESYTVERSTNGYEWSHVATISATGNTYYSIQDDSFSNTINYYRLSQTDNDGTARTCEENVVSIDNRIKNLKVISRTNILGQQVDEYATGLIIVTFEDGSSIKEYK